MILEGTTMRAVFALTAVCMVSGCQQILGLSEGKRLGDAGGAAADGGSGGGDGGGGGAAGEGGAQCGNPEITACDDALCCLDDGSGGSGGGCAYSSVDADATSVTSAVCDQTDTCVVNIREVSGKSLICPANHACEFQFMCNGDTCPTDTVVTCTSARCVALCEGDSGCNGLDLRCSEGAECAVQCLHVDGCEDMTYRCESGSRCRLECVPGATGASAVAIGCNDDQNCCENALACVDL
jgi:hypothetical protein